MGRQDFLSVQSCCRRGLWDGRKWPTHQGHSLWSALTVAALSVFTNTGWIYMLPLETKLMYKQTKNIRLRHSLNEHIHQVKNPLKLIKIMRLNNFLCLNQLCQCINMKKESQK